MGSGGGGGDLKIRELCGSAGKVLSFGEGEGEKEAGENADSGLCFEN
jgi:hypothetical protein